MKTLLSLPSELLIFTSDFLKFDEALIGYYATCRQLWDTRHRTKIRFLTSLKLLMDTLVMEPDRDLLQFCRNLGLIHLIPAFSHLPQRILSDPLQACLEGLSWSAVYSSAPEKQVSLFSDALTNYQSIIIHTLRFDWKNTQASAFVNRSDSLLITTFLFSLHHREAQLNRSLHARIRKDMESVPQFAVYLEPFLKCKIVSLWVKFHAVNDVDVTKLKEASMVLAFNVEFMETMAFLVNKKAQIDPLTTVHETSYVSVGQFGQSICPCCLFHPDHHIQTPISFNGARIKWSYDEHQKRHLMARCAVMPIHSLYALGIYVSVLPYAQFVASDLDIEDNHLHIHNCSPFYSEHICSFHEHQNQWPTYVDTRIENISELLDEITTAFVE